MLYNINVLKNFANFLGKHLCWNHFLIKLEAIRSVIKKRLRRRCFPVKFSDLLYLNMCLTLVFVKFLKNCRTVRRTVSLISWLVFMIFFEPVHSHVQIFWPKFHSSIETEISHKIPGTNQRNPVKLGKTRVVWFLLLRVFLLAIAKV